MPRKRKSQAAQVPTGLPYGSGEALANAQREIPLPGLGSRPQPVRGTGAPAAAGSLGLPAAAAPADPMAAALAAAAAMPPPDGGLARPTARPDEPVTAGLPIGPGAGPEVLGRASAPAPDALLAELIAAYRVNPDSDLGRIIARARAMKGQL